MCVWGGGWYYHSAHFTDRRDRGSERDLIRTIIASGGGPEASKKVGSKRSIEFLARVRKQNLGFIMLIFSKRPNF